MDDKEDAAKKAIPFVKKGMVVGLGTGSTANHFIRMLGERNRAEGLGLKCVATSIASEKLAQECGLRVVGLDEVGGIDVAVDGADVIVGQNLIKGLGGGAISREKVVDYLAKEFIVIADRSKVKKVFGGVVPIEVLPFAAEDIRRKAGKMGAKAEYRMKDGKRFVTDNGNLMLDCVFGKVGSPKRMERELKQMPGAFENGIFTRKCRVLIGGV